MVNRTSDFADNVCLKIFTRHFMTERQKRIALLHRRMFSINTPSTITPKNKWHQSGDVRRSHVYMPILLSSIEKR